MDPRERADATLARARARDGLVVTPDSAVSPMDAASTMQIPRAVVAEAEVREDPDPTVVLRDGEESTQPHSHPLQAEATTERQEHPQVATTAEIPVIQDTGEGPDGAQHGHAGMQQQDSLIPTVTRAEGSRPNVAQRLDGDNRSTGARRLG